MQKLTLPTGMVDLDPETERRAVSEGERLRELYRTITPDRLWRGRFVRPVAGHEAPSGFGARRVINGKPIPYGLFLGEIVNFLIIALVLFIFIVKFLGWIIHEKKQEQVAPPPPPKEQELLTEIRDLLKQRAA